MTAITERPRLHAVLNRDAARAAIAAEVRAEMARQHITGTQLAEVLHEKQQWVSRRVNGDVGFDSADLAIVADFLGVDIRQFTDAARTPIDPNDGPRVPPAGVEPATNRLEGCTFQRPAGAPDRRRSHRGLRVADRPAPQIGDDRGQVAA